jgi:hypothetical protein
LSWSLIPALGRDLDLAIARTEPEAEKFDLGEALAIYLSRASEPFAGRALSRVPVIMMLSFSSDKDVPNKDLHELVSSSFADVLAVGAERIVIPPDLLEETTKNALLELRKKLADSSDPSAEWTRKVTDHFKELARPVLRREIKVTELTAAILRILALCMAAEADALQCPNSSKAFYQVAAGITWLEQSHNGKSSPGQTIILALN